MRNPILDGIVARMVLPHCVKVERVPCQFHGMKEQWFEGLVPLFCQGSFSTIDT